MSTNQPTPPGTIADCIDIVRIPGFVAGSLVASVHRRAAEAALLRDRRLELAVAHSGELSVRMIEGVASTAS